jgi:hypothetical protein
MKKGVGSRDPTPSLLRDLRLASYSRWVLTDALASAFPFAFALASIGEVKRDG